jgi:hypothetical protein
VGVHGHGPFADQHRRDQVLGQARPTSSPQKKNDSIIVTLDPDHLSATTTVAVSPSFPSDRMWLNGKVSTNSLSTRAVSWACSMIQERVTAAVRFFSP